MKKITRLWQLMLLLVLTSSVAFSQAYDVKTSQSGFSSKKVQIKKQLLDEQLEGTTQVVPEFNGVLPMMQPEKFKKQKSVYKSSKGVLYSQMTLSVNNGGKASQDFSAANDAYDCIIAEDFTVSGGDWDLTKINFLGSWSSAGPAEGFHVEFYADNAGMPGASVAAYTSLPYTDDGAGLFEVWLPAPLTLTDGVTYWMSIQARMDFSVGGQWYWSEHDETAVVGAVGVWQNPGDGFGTGYTTWTAASTVWAGPPPSLNFAFELSDDPIPTCPAPSGMYAGNFTAASADLAWTENGTATLWDVEWGLAGFAQGTGTMLSGLASTSTSLAGLAGATAYDVYYRADCGGSQSTWVGPYTFMLPDYFGSITPTTSCQTDNGSFTAGGMAWYEVSLDAGFMYNLSVASCDVSCAGDMPVADGDFYFYDTDGMTLLWYVDGLSSCDYDASTWGSANESFTPSATGTYFLEVRDYFDDDADNFTLGYIAEAIPTCQEPTSLSTTDITMNSAKLNWATTGTNTQYEYGAVGFAPGTGAEIGSGSTHNLYADIAGLASTTTYDWYIRNDCGGGDYSAWVGSSFTTSCGTFGVPFEESFDVNVDPACWINTSSNNVANGLWEYGSQAQNAAGWGASAVDDHTGNGGFFAFSDGSSPEVSDVTFLTPFIDASTLTTPYLSFYVFSNNVDNPGDNVPLTVELWDGAAWNLITTYQADNADWVFVGFDLSAYPLTGDVQFRFITDQTATVNEAWYNDILIDDVFFGEMPTCPEPTALFVENTDMTGTDLGWTSNSGMSNIEYGLAGFTIGVDPIGTASGVTSTYPVTGLVEGTVYEFYVQDDCGGGDLSLWAGPFSFIPVPHNDECMDAEYVAGPYPVTVTGTTVGSTESCPVALAGWEMVWYEIELPYGMNRVQLDLCIDGGVALTNTGIVLMEDCCGDKIYSDGTWAVNGSCLNDLVFEVEGPGTVYYPVMTEPKSSFSFDVDVTMLPSIYGSLMYANGASTMMDHSTVTLTDAVPTNYDYLTECDGYFNFNGFADGDYDLTGSTTKEWGGLGVVDAILTQRFIAGLFVLSPLQQLAADVSQSGTPGVVDAIMLKRRITGLTFPAWTAPDYVFETYTLTLAGVEINQDVYGLCSGDVNGSFVPAATCEMPTNLSATEISPTEFNLSWDGSGSADLEWGPAGFALGSGTLVAGVTSPYNLTGLTAGDSYDFYVMNYCCGGTPSDWAGPFTFPPPPPANDDCANAEVIGEVVDYGFNTSNASTSGLDAHSVNQDLWYAYTPAVDGTIDVDLCGSSFDTKVVVYSGTCGALTELAYNDDDCGLQSGVSAIAVTAGQTYLIQVGGYGSNSGSGDLTITLY